MGFHSQCEKWLLLFLLALNIKHVFLPSSCIDLSCDMCGIAARLRNLPGRLLCKWLADVCAQQQQQQLLPDEDPTLARDAHDHLLFRRGPDVGCCRKVASAASLGNRCVVELSGYVLHLRGDDVSVQPACHQPAAASTSSMLLWNGEVFGGDVWTVTLSSGMESDTSVMLRHLSVAENLSQDGAEFVDRAASLLESTAGPFAAIFWSAKFHVLLFSRDPIGRRSLVFGYSATAGDCYVASIGEPQQRLRKRPYVKCAEEGLPGLDVSAIVLLCGGTRFRSALVVFGPRQYGRRSFNYSSPVCALEVAPQLPPLRPPTHAAPLCSFGR